jgi:hypothetical protein
MKLIQNNHVMQEKLFIIKIGGALIDDEELLKNF